MMFYPHAKLNRPLCRRGYCSHLLIVRIAEIWLYLNCHTMSDVFQPARTTQVIALFIRLCVYSSTYPILMVQDQQTKAIHVCTFTFRSRQCVNLCCVETFQTDLEGADQKIQSIFKVCRLPYTDNLGYFCKMSNTRMRCWQSGFMSEDVCIKAN